MNNIEIMDYMIQLRKEKRLTQQYIADETGMLRPNVVRLEKSRAAMSIDVLLRYAGALGYDVDFTLIKKENNRKKCIGLGCQDFEEIINENLFYVDKSLFIKEWWESSDRVTLITRPRRFGKTLNLSMLDRFFSISYKNDTNHFENLKIYTADKGKYRELQNTYPVIFISFAGVKSESYEAAVRSIIFEIEDAYRRYLCDEKIDVNGSIDNSVVSKDDVLNFEKNELSLSIKKLCRLLYDKYHKKVIVLLDEYDTPMQEAWANGYYDKMSSLIRDLFNNTFKTNRYLYRAVMTGITRISQESLFSDLNNISYAGITDDKYADCFGFTTKEVRSALKNQSLEEHLEAVKLWYDGFNIGLKTDIYNPWSITNFLKTQKLEPYWVNTSSNRLVSELIISASDIEKRDFQILLKGGKIKCTYKQGISFENMKSESDNLWSLLIATGYLKINPSGEVSVTNHETMIMFKDLVRAWFGKSKYEYNEFIKALLSCDISNMNDYLNALLLNVASFFDVTKEAEGFYHGLTLGILVELDDTYELTSNRESGFGRYDIMLVPKSGEKQNAYIIEFKIFDKKRDRSLEDTVNSALNQIENKRYETELIKLGIKAAGIKKLGIAFNGKKALIGVR